MIILILLLVAVIGYYAGKTGGVISPWEWLPAPIFGAILFPAVVVFSVGFFVVPDGLDSQAEYDIED